MEDLKTIESKVKYILINDPDTRDDDDLLYLEVCKMQIKTEAVSLDYFLKHRKSSCIPTYESVGRVRRKLQEKYENLRGVRWTERENAIKDFVDYSRT